MKIAIDATRMNDPAGRRGAGIEHYTWSVLLSLIQVAPEITFCVILPPTASPKRILRLQTQPNVRLIKMRKTRIPFFSRHVFLPLRLSLQRVQVLFSPHGQLPYLWKGKSVATIHDLHIFEHPEWFPEGASQSFSTRTLVPRTLAQATELIAVSDATRTQLSRLFPETSSRITVVHEGVTVPETIPPLSSRFQSLLNQVEDVLLFLGTIEPRKNVLTALHAFHRFLEMHPQRASTTRFVLAGQMGWKSEEVEEAIADVNRIWKRRAGGQVVSVVGYVDPKDKWALLSRASALVMLSHNEGFGLPLLEAMGVGTPVIASEIPVFREVGGDELFYVDANDPEQAALTIAQVLFLPEGMGGVRTSGKKHARGFRWEDAAQKTLDVLLRAASSEPAKNRDTTRRSEEASN